MFTETEQYYLAQFLSERYDLQLEDAIKQIEDPDVNSMYNYQFVTDPFSFSDADLDSRLSTEFIERENQLHYLTKAYTKKRPSIMSGYFDLLQVTAEKETELDLDQTNKWYTQDQLEEVRYELEYIIGWIQQQIYDESGVPDSFVHLYDLNCALMLYGLEKSEQRISVDYKNSYRALRGVHSNGYIENSPFDSYARSIGMRLAGVFTSDKDVSKSDSEQDELCDMIVDKLAKHYEGPLRKLVKSVEWSVNEHYTDDY